MSALKKNCPARGQKSGAKKHELRMSDAVKIYARDGEDVAVISAYLQDAVAQIGDMTYLAKQRRFVLLANRFCWENDKTPMRVRAALQIGGVTAIQHTKLNLARRDGVVSVLALRQDDADMDGDTLPPMRLIFSGGGEIRLEVEACEVILEDITAPWKAQSRPVHTMPDDGDN